MEKIKKKYPYFILLFAILILPFFISQRNDLINAKSINDSTIGHYQSTTCQISLIEVLLTNLNIDEKLYINNNNYAGIECFGKVTGLDKVGDTFFLSIGTNTMLSIILQITLWMLLIFIFSEKRHEKVKLSYLPVFANALLFTIQQISENRFYAQSNIYYNNSLEVNNYYLLSYFFIFLLTSLVIKDLFENRDFNFLFFIPFMYLFPATFMGMNLNLYLLIFSFFGFQSLLFKKTNKLFNYIYTGFSFIWIINKKETINFLDTDKLRGFINSSNNMLSTIFWIIVFYLVINGIFYLLSNEKVSNSLVKLKNGFLVSGSIITILGLLGSNSSALNFFNFYIFGQNKRGMKSLESVAGNTWRGFASSAEFIGEFYAISLLVTIYYYLSRNKKNIYKDAPFIILCLFGLYKSNNFAAIISLIGFSSFLILKIRYKISLKKKQLLGIFLITIFLIGGILYLSDYQLLSTILIEEALLHSELFQFSDNYINFLNKDRYFQEQDYMTLLDVENNYTRVSSSLLLLINIYTPKFDIPLIPNIVALLSAVSLLINRTELWGIFIAKYSPSFTDAAFGYGPHQLSNYLYDHRIRLDVPEYKLNMLYLPHSSLLDSVLFFGITGILIFVLYCSLKVYKNNYNNGLFYYLLIFLVLNLLKSDSLLYTPTFVLFIGIFYKTFIEKNNIK
tara:strand:+ start:1693 stop:3723 length:2031 start_codon:yes stop_codon:yes gene_type:complete